MSGQWDPADSPMAGTPEDGAFKVRRTTQKDVVEAIRELTLAVSRMSALLHTVKNSADEMNKHLARMADRK